MRVLNLIGKRFSRLLVIGREKNIKNRGMWLCICDCGKKITVRSDFLTAGHTKSCGCLKRELFWLIKHGGCKKNPRLYGIWENIKLRCYNSKNKDYKDYGGRGITVYKKWLSFENFYQWAINHGYADNLTIDRINNDGNYKPNNCRWATPKMQANNRRNNKYITFNGVKRFYSEWEKYLGFPVGVIYQRKRRGWSDERTLTQIPRKCQGVKQ